MDSAHARAARAYPEQSRRARPDLRLVEEPPPRDPVTGRRTVKIKGQPTAPRRRSPAAAQISARPDRVAMWAVMLGLFLVFMAVVTASPA